MKRRIMLLVALLLLLPSIVLATSNHTDPPLQTDGDSLVVPAGTTYTGDLATIDQSLVIDGVVEGDVTSLLGSITVRGAVEGDVVSLFGNVVFEDQAVADGNVMAAVGNVTMAQPLTLAANHTVLSGNLSGQGVASFLPGSSNRPITAVERTLLIAVLALIALVGAVLVSLIWPRSIAAGARIVAVAFSRSFELGLIWLVMTGLLVAVFGAILVFTLVGLAVLPLLLLLVQVPYIVGLAVMGRAAGERLGQHGLAATVAGGALLSIPGIACASLGIPFALLAFYLINGTGIGALFLLRAAVIQRNTAEA